MRHFSKSELEALSSVAETAALRAGEYIQSQFDKTYLLQQKVGGDSLASQVVTEVDFKAQEIVLRHLESTIDTFDLGVLTEELADDHSRFEKSYFWCIDPMDGTLPFTERRTGYAVSIALVTRDGNSILGVVYVPDSKDCYIAYQGNGVRLNGEIFNLPQNTNEKVIHFWMDGSLKSEPYFPIVLERMTQYASEQKMTIECHDRFGGVRNAIGVMCSKHGCYFKYPKKSPGCGSIWDYAATSVFFKELGLIVSNSSGEELHLNDSDTTFLNQQGVLFATNKALQEAIISWNQ